MKITKELFEEIMIKTGCGWISGVPLTDDHVACPEELNVDFMPYILVEEVVEDGMEFERCIIDCETCWKNVLNNYPWEEEDGVQ